MEGAQAQASEMQHQAELDDPRVVGAGDLAKAARSESRADATKVGVVEYIIKLKSKF